MIRRVYDRLAIDSARAVVKEEAGVFVLPQQMYIVVSRASGVCMIFLRQNGLKLRPKRLTDIQFHLVVAAEGVDAAREIRVVFDEAAGHKHTQGYALTIRPGGIEIRARAAAGTFYGFQTLMQILREAVFAGKTKSKSGKGGRSVRLPCVTIEDWPDYAKRGVYHDCARGKIPTVDTLLQLIDDLGHLKINEFQLYVENGFEFRKHPGDVRRHDAFHGGRHAAARCGLPGAAY